MWVAISSLIVACVLAVGCQHPIRVNMSGDIVTRMPTDNTAQPVRQRVVAGDSCACEKIAIIDVDGVLLNRNFSGLNSMGENPVALFHEKLQAAQRDPLVKGVVLRINSPGGSVTASDLMRRDLLQFKQQCGKPVVASLLDVGAGGAYYLASACDYVTAHPTSIVGGIGVIINVYSLEDTLQQQNVESQAVRAGEFIDLGTPVKRMDDEGQQILEEIADEFHQRFIDAVAMYRPMADRSVMDGRILTANRAAAAGLVDEIAYLDDTIRHAEGLAGLGGSARVVMFRRCNDRALTEFDITPNSPSSLATIPLNIPGLDRAGLPHFLYLWQPEPSLEIRGY
jgi:protease-4